MHACVFCVNMCTQVQVPTEGQVSDLELLVAVNHLAWVLGIELQHSGKLCVLLNAKPNFQPPFVPFLIFVVVKRCLICSVSSFIVSLITLAHWHPWLTLKDTHRHLEQLRQQKCFLVNFSADYFLKIFICVKFALYRLCIYRWVWAKPCLDQHSEARWQLREGVSCLLLSCGLWGLNSSSHAWQSGPPH